MLQPRLALLLAIAETVELSTDDISVLLDYIVMVESDALRNLRGLKHHLPEKFLTQKVKDRNRSIRQSLGH